MYCNNVAAGRKCSQPVASYKQISRTNQRRAHRGVWYQFIPRRLSCVKITTAKNNRQARQQQSRGVRFTIWTMC